MTSGLPSPPPFTTSDRRLDQEVHRLAQTMALFPAMQLPRVKSHDARYDEAAEKRNVRRTVSFRHKYV